MHRVFIWTQRPLNIRFRAITASPECEGRDKQPNFKADQTQAQDSTPAKSWLRCALNTAALNTAQRIGTDTQAYLQGLSARQLTDYFLVLREPHGGERDDGRRGAADGAPAGRARRAAAGLLIFDKDAEIARCCADSTVPMSVPRSADR